MANRWCAFCRKEKNSEGICDTIKRLSKCTDYKERIKAMTAQQPPRFSAEASGYYPGEERRHGGVSLQNGPTVAPSIEPAPPPIVNFVPTGGVPSSLYGQQQQQKRAYDDAQAAKLIANLWGIHLTTHNCMPVFTPLDVQMMLRIANSVLDAEARS